MIRLLLADDHTMFTDGLAMLLSQHEEISVVGSATDGEMLLTLLRIHSADIVLLDINMPGMNGIESCARIRKEFPGVRVIIISMYKTREFIQSLYRLGADGYLLKNTGREELITAIKTVHGGGSYFSAEVAQVVLEEKTAMTSFPEKAAMLSGREIEIVKLVAKGLNNDEIGDQLFISQHTVKTHRKKILQKLEMNTTAELVSYAARLGLLPE
jgi:DNA-binding NarL/FixJ family response regulator